MSALRAYLLTAPAIVISTIVMGSISLVVSLFDPGGRRQHRVARVWSRILLCAGGIRVTVEGLENLAPGARYVVVSNHQSLMDIPVLMAYLPLEFRFFAKVELYPIPFLGWHLRRAGHLPVVRTDARAALATLNSAARAMARGQVSMLIFPEGGRVPEGEVMREFKEGAAHLAIKAGVPALPISVDGVREILPMGSLKVLPGRVRLRIGRPLPTAGLRPHDRARLNLELQENVAGLLGISPTEVSPGESAAK